MSTPSGLQDAANKLPLNHEEQFKSTSKSTLTAHIAYQDPYVQPLILSALSTGLPNSKFNYDLVTTQPLESSESSRIDSGQQTLQILPYESLSFDLALASPPGTFLINSYVYRKALIRKHFLANVVRIWNAKNPGSVLGQHVPVSCELEVDYAEFLDDAVVEAWELRESLKWGENDETDELEEEEGNHSEDEKTQNNGIDREWWLLKPGMSDGANGIRLFNTEAQLRGIFEAWDPPDSEDELDEDENVDNSAGNGVITSQLRHFVAQRYIHPPLLLSSQNQCKFHIRTYVLAVGALKVYVYQPMLALFSSSPYVAPWQTPKTNEGEFDLSSHLTNTCFQTHTQADGIRQGEVNVNLFWDLEDKVLQGCNEDWKSSTWLQICAITSELFLAALRSDAMNFQPIPCSFEVFGIDFLVDAEGKTWLLEVNAFPDFKQTGNKPGLKQVVQGFWEEVVEVAVKPYFFPESTSEDNQMERKQKEKLVKVLDIETGR